MGASDAQITASYAAPTAIEVKKILGQIFSFAKLTLGKLSHIVAEIAQGVGSFTQDKFAPGVGGVRKGLGGLGTTLRYNFPKRKVLKFLFIALAIVGVVLLARTILSLSSRGGSSNNQVLGAKATQFLNKEISFPLMDEEGNEVSRISYMVEKAELMDEILVKGEKATAIKGRTFFVLTIKIKNDFDKSIEINTKDYVRLKIAGSEELLAPDIHNDPVTVQAISTKYTRLGFPINDSDRQVTLRLGEINGPKESLDVKF